MTWSRVTVLLFPASQFANVGTDANLVVAKKETDNQYGAVSVRRVVAAAAGQQLDKPCWHQLSISEVHGQADRQHIQWGQLQLSNLVLLEKFSEGGGI